LQRSCAERGSGSASPGSLAELVGLRRRTVRRSA